MTTQTESWLEATDPQSSPELNVTSQRKFRRKYQQWIEALTPRELEILRLISSGLSNQEIADQLVIALSTVKRHTANIYDMIKDTVSSSSFSLFFLPTN